MTGVEFITDSGPRISGEVTPMVIFITDGVGEGNLGMVTNFCHHNQNKMEASDAHLHPMPVWLPRGQYSAGKEIHQNPWHSPRNFSASLLPQHQYSLSGVPPLPSCLWTVYVYKGYFHTLRPRCSYLMKRGRFCLKYIPTSKRFYGKVPKRSTTSLTQCCYQSLICFPPLSRRRHSDRGRTGLQPSPPVIAKLSSGKNSAGLWTRWGGSEASP